MLLLWRRNDSIVDKERAAILVVAIPAFVVRVGEAIGAVRRFECPPRHDSLYLVGVGVVVVFDALHRWIRQHRRRDSNFRVEQYVHRVRQRNPPSRRVVVVVAASVVRVLDRQLRLGSIVLVQIASRIQSVAKHPWVLCTHAIRNTVLVHYCCCSCSCCYGPRSEQEALSLSILAILEFLLE